jgi:CheY-like chemotaxis protein
LPARVLVVDDDPLAGELICEILRTAGMEASFLTSSTEAAELLKREKYHAVFLDMRMPVLRKNHVRMFFEIGRT